MNKDFDDWNRFKKLINKKEINDEFNFHPGDIWWTALGIYSSYPRTVEGYSHGPREKSSPG